MKLQCENCGELAAPASFRVDDGVPVFTCGVCGVENRAEETAERPAAPAPPISSIPRPAPQKRVAPTPGHASGSLPVAKPVSRSELGPDEVKCPKCFHRQRRAKHCVRCGLDLRRADQLRHHFEPDPKGNEEAYARGLELWAAVEKAPHESRAHEEFLSFCTDRGLLELAARRYRERVSDYPGETPATDFMRRVNERMEALAVSMLSADTWSKDLSVKVKRVKRALVVAALVLAILGITVLGIVVLKSGGPAIPR